MKRVPARPTLALALLLWLPTLAPPLSAHPADDWVGQRVILQFGSVLRDNRGVRDNQKLRVSDRGKQTNTFRVYRVTHVNGPWIWLKAENEGAAGWIRAGDIPGYALTPMGALSSTTIYYKRLEPTA